MKIRNVSRAVGATVMFVALSCRSEEGSSRGAPDREYRLQRISDLRLDLTRERAANTTNVQDKCRLIISALQEQLKEPRASRRENNYWTQNEYAQIKYLDMLLTLGPSAMPALTNVLSSIEGRPHEIVQIVMAKHGDEQSYSEVLKNLENGRDPFIRFLTIRVLGYSNRQDLVPILKKALKDPYVKEGSDSAGTFRIFPIREEALDVLKRLGVRVQRKGDEFTIAD